MLLAVTKDDRFRRAVIFLLGLIATVAVIAAMRSAKGIVVPIMFAGFIALLTAPAVAALRRRNWPSSIAVSVVLLGLIGLVIVAGAALGSSVQELAAKAPTYRDLFMERVASLTDPLGERAQESATDFFSVFDPGRAMSLAAGVLSSVTNMLGNAAIILLILMFVLLEVSGFPRKLQAAFPNARAVLDTSDAIAQSVKRYFAIKAVISLATGVSIGVFVAVQGLDFPVLWGVLAFFFNFIPNIGSLLAAIPAVILSFIQLGPGQALLTAVGYLAANTIFGSIIEPRMAGQGVGLSPLVVILSLVFWGWVLGPVGMLLSVPLTAALRIAMETSPTTEWLAVMLGPTPN